jgi:hypothetical protein
MKETTARRVRLAVVGLVMALAAAPLGFAGGTAEPADPRYGRGMMGGRYGGYGPGMMGGDYANGPGMMGGGFGMMGQGFQGLDDSLPRSVDIGKAQAIVSDYLAGLSNKKLKIDEIMEFENNLYVLVKETDTGRGAFELLVDPFTGALRPEFGPNMMWNLKYGMMSWRAGAVRPNTIPLDEAKKIASEYLERVRGHGPYELSGDEFYGYYTIDVKKDGLVLGMLSVNAYSGQVWYHTWHGGYIGMQEGTGTM